MAIGDIDGDGKPDIAVANAVHGPSTVSVYHNIGRRGVINETSFAPDVRFPVGDYAFNIAMGDLDGDGKPDLVTANIETADISVLRNTARAGAIDGDSFAPRLDLPTVGRAFDVAIGDLDRDGKADRTALRYTRYGKFTYAIGANPQAARVSGINIEAHLVKVYVIAGLLAGLAGIVTAARAETAQASMGVGYELDAIAATVIGGTSLTGGVGRITGTVIGTVILGVMTSGFTFLRIDAYYQEIVKGVIIIAAVVIDVYRQKKRTKH